MSPDKMLKKVLRRPAAGAAATVVVIFACVLGLWRGGWLQFAELQLYDRMVRGQPTLHAAESRIVVVGITDADIQELKTHPVPDARLAEALETLAGFQPAAIAVDIYRDLPVPEKGEDSYGKLREVFERYENILAIRRVGLGDTVAVNPPQFLLEKPAQVGINDFPVDYQVDGTARRSLLLMDDGNTVYYSLSLMASMLYLELHHLPYFQDESQRERISLGKAVFYPFQPNDGAYVSIDARGYQMLLDYRAPHDFPIYSLFDVLDHRVPREAVEGRVVLVGSNAVTLKDYLRTPIDTRYPGVLLHAQLVDQLLRAAIDGMQELRFWNEWQEGLWILAWTAVGAALGTWVRPPITFSLGLAACFGALFAAVWLAFGAGYWLLAVGPGVGLGGAATLGTTCAAYLEREERGLLMQLFARIVSPEIAAALLGKREEILESGRMRPHKLTATVLFTDLQGYSGMAEKMDPVVLMGWLNEYMEVMTEVVFKHHGVVNKFMGDAVMAMFGPPFPRETDAEIREDALNAVRCAMAMNGELRLLNERWQTEGRPTSQMRVGIYTGVVVGGSIGNRQRQEYTVTGDTVNIAARLEGAEKERADFANPEKPCRILVGETTYSLLDGQFESEQIGSMELHGKKTRVMVYLIRGEKQREEAGR